MQSSNLNSVSLIAPHFPTFHPLSTYIKSSLHLEKLLSESYSISLPRPRAIEIYNQYSTSNNVEHKSSGPSLRPPAARYDKLHRPSDEPCLASPLGRRVLRSEDPDEVGCKVWMVRRRLGGVLLWFGPIGDMRLRVRTAVTSSRWFVRKCRNNAVTAETLFRKKILVVVEGETSKLRPESSIKKIQFLDSLETSLKVRAVISAEITVLWEIVEGREWR